MRFFVIHAFTTSVAWDVAHRRTRMVIEPFEPTTRRRGAREARAVEEGFVPPSFVLDVIRPRRRELCTDLLRLFFLRHRWKCPRGLTP